MSSRSQDDRAMERRNYGRFGLMIAVSTCAMFALTYTNVYIASDIHLSEERVYMAVLMGSVMAIIMLAFMWGAMYRNVKVNAAIVVVALTLAAGALTLSRSQALVDDRAYMKGMIPHHSIAQMTSERADIDDVRVRRLADGISDTQRREIREMEWLVDDIAENGPATTEADAAERPVPDFPGTR